MARQARNVRLQTKEARKRLPVAHEPYWHEVRRGMHIGYRQGTTGGTWWLREYREGKLHKRRVGMADSDTVAADGRAVLTWEMVNERAVDPERPTTKPLGLYTVKQALKDYFENRTADSPPDSVATDRAKATGQIEPGLGSEPVDGLTTAKLAKWRNALIPTTEDPELRRRAQATANRLWTILRAALNLAYRNGYAATAEAWKRIKPFEDVDRPGERFLSESECRRLLNACDPEFRALTRGALYSGCRLGELLRLTAADIADGSLIVRHSKSGKQRFVPLSEEGQAFFEQQSAGAGGSALLFEAPRGKAWSRVAVSRAIRVAATVAKITPAVSFRDLRRTYGSLLINKGIDGAVIQQLLGHADQRMTHRVYARLLDKTLRQAVRKKSPKFGFDRNNVRTLKA